mgnify:CR=1 FL=1
MNVSNFTEKSKETITNASTITTKNNNPEIRDFHMMAAFLSDSQGLVTMLFKKMDVDVNNLSIIIQSDSETWNTDSTADRYLVCLMG